MIQAFRQIDLPENVQFDKEVIETWKIIPLWVKEEKAIDTEKILNLFLDAQILKPSSKAELTQTILKKYIIFQTIDKFFIHGIKNYAELLKKVTQEDLLKNQNLVPNTRERSSTLFSNLLGKSKTSKNQKKIYKKHKLNALERKKCLAEIAIREKIRLETTIEVIKERLNVLKTIIKPSKELIDKNAFEEMENLNKFIQKIVPNADIKIKSESISNYLQKLISTEKKEIVLSPSNNLDINAHQNQLLNLNDL